jgi:hypothetical protein
MSGREGREADEEGRGRSPATTHTTTVLMPAMISTARGKVRPLWVTDTRGMQMPSIPVAKNQMIAVAVISKTKGL